MFSYERVYSKEQELKILSEFKRTKELCYLEHAGATLYSEKQIANIQSDLASNLYSNPHARTTSSKLTEDSIDQIRYQILNHFNTNPHEYSVIFTNGATGALKLVSDAFNYNNGSFVYLEDNHTSVLGMRHNALNVKVLTHDEAFNTLNNFNRSNDNAQYESNDNNSLFAYPAQCNYSGTKYPLTWIKHVQDGALNHICDSKRWYCLVDAAGYVSTSHLDLSDYKPDFVCISFYKIFGYPTGLGALLVKKDSEEVLHKKYYGGGTVFMALSLQNIAIPRVNICEKFEDGTLSFLSILSLKHGFETLKRLCLNMEQISKHTFSLGKYVYNQLLTLHHSNGEPLAILYHDTTFEDRTHQGAVVNFNLLRSSGQYVGYAEVLHIANLFGIQVRTGCLCNPGACQRHLKLSTDDMIRHFEKGHVCGDQNDLIDGVPTGSVRISFGYMSNRKDADAFLNMIEDCFIERPCIRKIPRNYDAIRELYRKKFCVSTDVENNIKSNFVKQNNEEKEVNNVVIKPADIGSVATLIQTVLNYIYIYPIKSCAAFKIKNSCRLVATGLKYDREWMIVNESGVCITQKANSNLCKIKPFINLDSNVLELTFEGLQKISIPLKTHEAHTLKVYPCRSKVCGDPIIGWDCGQEVSDWLSRALNETRLRLLRQCGDRTNARMKMVQGESVMLSLANQAQFLLVNKSSIEWLQRFLSHEDSFASVEDLIDRFRPNFVVDFGKPFLENDLQELNIENVSFKATGICTRCQIICIDQKTGEKNPELLRVLSREFGGKISFGMYLKQESANENTYIDINSVVAAKITTVEKN